MFTKNYGSVILRLVLVLVWMMVSLSVNPVSASVQLKNENEYIGTLPNRLPNSDLDLGTPIYDWHTFFQSGELQDSTVDAQGNLYMVGYSSFAWDSPNSTPPVNPFQGVADIVVVKLNNQGAYQWHTFLGSTEFDLGNGITTDTEGNIYIAGQSYASWTGPNGVSPLSSFAAGEDMVVVMLDSDGTYQWHTFFGTPIIADGSGDHANDISVDPNWNLYIVGNSEDTWNGPGSVAPKNNTDDGGATVIKLGPNGNYQWHTFYGVNAGAAYVSLDNLGSIYIAGSETVNWSGPNSQTPLHAATNDAFGDFMLLKLNSLGDYQWHTFYGATSSPDLPGGMDVDGSGNIYIAGQSNASWNAPTLPLHAYAGGTADLVIMKLSSSGVYQWHTFYGSNASDAANGIRVNTSGDVTVGGQSSATWNGPGSVPPLNPFTPGTFGFENEITVLQLNNNGAYQWHTFYGSSNGDSAYSVNTLAANIWITGTSRASWNGPGNTAPLNSAGAPNSFNFFAIKMAPPVVTRTVTNINDSGVGSLRQAIADSNAGDTITFDASLSGQTITLGSTLVINKDLTIDGSSLSTKLSISGNNSVQVLNILAGTSVTIQSLNITNGRSVSYGAGIYSEGALTLIDSAFANNVVSGNDWRPNGGAIANYHGTLTVVNGTFSDNRAQYTVSGSGGGLGGAIYNFSGMLTVSDSTFNNNVGNRGGAIWCQVGTMTVANSSFFSNRATGGSSGDGGAIFESCQAGISNSTFSENSASHSGGAILSFNETDASVVTNSTLTGNTASQSAGGIAAYGPMILTNSTFSNNAAVFGGAVRVGLGTSLSLRNSILANSIGSVDCIKSDGAPPVENINNLIESTGSEATFESCGVSLLTSDPLLAPLADNGGMTETMALLVGSPAINAGNAESCPVTDQRGVARPQGGGCDIGAYEYVFPPTPTPSNSATPTNTPTLTPTASRTPTITRTPTAGGKPTKTSTPSRTPSPTRTTTSTSTFTLTPTRTFTPTLTPSSTHVTITATWTHTPSRTPSHTPTIPVTNTFTPSPTTTSSFPTTVVRDNFNRANGPIGNSWFGYPSAFSIASNQLDVTATGSNTFILWKSSSLGADQEAYVTLSQIDTTPGNEHRLILKSQNSKNVTSGLISVVYDAAGQTVQVWTYHPTQGWVQHGTSIPIMFVNGDQFGARARPNGTVEVYQNGTLLGTRSITSWPFYNSGGYIGMWFVNAPNALLDNFGGGTR